jgi:hypothetical protein
MDIKCCLTQNDMKTPVVVKHYLTICHDKNLLLLKGMRIIIVTSPFKECSLLQILIV